MELTIDTWEDIKKMSLNELKEKYQKYLKENIVGNDKNKLAFLLERSTGTVDSYLNGSGSDIWTMRLFVDCALSLIKEKSLS